MIRNISTFLLFLGFSFVISYYYPHISLSPGNVQSYHQKIEQDCSKCHTGFSGVTNEKCISCHNPEDIKTEKFMQAPKNAAVKVSIKALHQEIGQASCYTCHPEHAARKLLEIKFVHDTSLKSNCQNCHIRPVNKIHEKVAANCSTCHSTKQWKGAKFTHSSQQKDCLSCHKKPEDSLHKPATNCNTCHNTSRWKPASFDHSRYFRFSSDHPDRCENCHTQGNYSQYTCYNCHEHTEIDVRRRHLRLGLKSYDNCAQCHRSASEREAWENIQKFRNPKIDGTTRSTPRGGSYRGGGEHEDDEHEYREKRRGNEHRREHDDDDDD